jgi:hypothetical protein
MLCIFSLYLLYTGQSKKEHLRGKQWGKIKIPGWIWKRRRIRKAAGKPGVPCLQVRGGAEVPSSHQNECSCMVWMQKCNYCNSRTLQPTTDRLCGPVVRVPGCRTRGTGYDYRRYQISCVAVGLEWGPLSPCEDVRINDELLERKCNGSGPENWD